MSTFPKLIRGSKLVKICTGDNLDSSVLNNLGGNKKGFMYSAKLGLLGAGLVTLIGCAEFDEYLNQNQNDLLGAMAETTALTNPDLTDEQRASLGVMSRYAYREGDQKSEREVARQGRSSVNVYTGDQGSQTKKYQQQEKSNYERWNELPLIYFCTGGIEDGEFPTGVGTKIITPDIKKYYIVGRWPVFEMGKEVINVDECVTTGEKFIPHRIIHKEKGYNKICTFTPAGGFEYARKKGFAITDWKNTWYVDGKKIAEITHTLINTEMIKEMQINQEKLKNRLEKNLVGKSKSQ